MKQAALINSALPPNKKRCKKCWAVKERSEFYKEGRSPDLLMARCKTCCSEVMKEQHSRPEVKRRRAVTSRARLYGVSELFIEELIAAQGGKCAICAKLLGEGALTQVDHCHKTGRVRGLLCPGCNRTLGLYSDNSDIFRRFVAYLGEK